MTEHALLSTDTASPKIAIIGGGLTGLLTATLLERASAQTHGLSSTPHITIFEKSRSVGRLATRYRTDSDTGKVLMSRCHMSLARRSGIYSHRTTKRLRRYPP